MIIDDRRETIEPQKKLEIAVIFAEENLAGQTKVLINLEAAAEAIKAGAANYIVKPFESKSVLETVEKTLS